MDKLIFDNGNKKVQVNEQGDYIIIPMGDNSFPQRIVEFTEEVEKIYEQLIEKEEEMSERKADITEKSKVRADIFINIGISFDRMFGNGSCLKVFGNNAPGQDLMIQFLEGLEPLVKKYAIERQKNIEEKYGKSSKRRK